MRWNMVIRNNTINMKIPISVWLLSVLVVTDLKTGAQAPFVCEPLLRQTKELMANLPASSNEAYQQRDSIVTQFTRLDQSILSAYPALSAKVNGRSARLYTKRDTVQNPVLLLLPPSQKMVDFFQLEWGRMEALEKAYTKAAPSFHGSKELYASKGYLPPWDSVYRKRLPYFMPYRDGVLKLVQTELAYLKANERMFFSKNEDERMQWVEAELAVLQKLAMLRTNYHKTFVRDGIEKVIFCKERLANCR